MEKKHSHVISIFTFKYLYLLIIPLIRGFFAAFQGGLDVWLAGAWMDLLVLFLTIAFCTLQWNNNYFSVDKHYFVWERGIFFKRRMTIPIRKIVTMSIVSSFYLKPFNAVRINIDTLAGSSRHSDFSLIIKESDANFITRKYWKSKRLTRSYEPSNIYIVALSLLTSNSFGGIVLMSTFISQSGELLGEQITSKIYGTFEEITSIMAFGIPPAAAAITYIILFGWLLAFAVNIVRNMRFKAKRGEHQLEICGGVLTNRKYIINYQSISLVNIRQSLFTKLLGLYSVAIYAPGFGKEDDDIGSLIPASNKRNMLSNMNLLIPEFAISARTAKPNIGSIFKFIIDPFWYCTLIPLAAWIFGKVLPSWSQFIYFIGFMCTVPAIWFMMVRIIDFATSGVGKINDMYTLRYSSGFYLQTVIIPKNKIANVSLRQSILQRSDNKCDLIVYTFHEGFIRHHCKNLDKSILEEMFEYNTIHEN